VRAAMFYEPGDVRIEDVPVPEPGPGGVLVRIGAALTCGTDVKTYWRGHPTLITETPSPFGHEFGGTITAVGEGVESWRTGTRAVAANSAPCNRCYYDKVGDQSMCENLAFLNGAFAEYIVVPSRIVEQNLYEIPEGVGYSRAALLEPLSCAVHGMVRTPVSMGDTVAVVEAGQIGLMSFALRRSAGPGWSASTRAATGSRSQGSLGPRRPWRPPREWTLSGPCATGRRRAGGPTG